MCVGSQPRQGHSKFPSAVDDLAPGSSDEHDRRAAPCVECGPVALGRLRREVADVAPLAPDHDGVSVVAVGRLPAQLDVDFIALRDTLRDRGAVLTADREPLWPIGGESDRLRLLLSTEDSHEGSLRSSRSRPPRRPELDPRTWNRRPPRTTAGRLVTPGGQNQQPPRPPSRFRASRPGPMKDRG